MQSDLIRAMLARQIQRAGQSGPSPWEAIGNIALTAALMKREKEATQTDQKDQNKLALTLANQFADKTQVPLETINGEPPASPMSVNAAPVTSTPQYGALQGMPKDVLQQAVVNQMLGGADKPQVVAAGGALVQNGKEIYRNPKSASDNPPTSIEEYAAVLDKPPSEWTTADRAGYREFLKGKGVNVEVNTGEDSFGKGVGAGAAEALGKEYEEARTASQSIPSYDRALALLDSGVVSGTGAEARLALARGLKTLGVYDGDVSNTDEYLSQAGKFVAEEIKAFGSGTGLSDADREFARKIAGGDIGINADSLRRILKIGRKARINKLSYFNGRRSALSEVNDLVGRAYPEFQIPEEPTPEQDRRSRAGL